MVGLRGAIDLASAQGIPCVGCGHRRDSNVDAKENVKLFALAYGPLADYAESKNVKLVFENWPNAGRNLMSTPELWDKCFTAVPSKAIGLCMDPSHLVWQGSDYLRATKDFGDRIYHAHAKDTEFIADGLYRYGMYGSQTETGASPTGWWSFLDHKSLLQDSWPEVLEQDVEKFEANLAFWRSLKTWTTLEGNRVAESRIKTTAPHGGSHQSRQGPGKGQGGTIR